MPAVQTSLSGEGGFFFLFHLRYFQCAQCDRPEQKSCCLLQLRQSGGQWEGGGRFSSWSVSLSMGVDGGYNHCAVDGSFEGSDG